MALRRLCTIRNVYLSEAKIGESFYRLEKPRSYYSRGVSNVLEHNGQSGSFCLYKGRNALPWTNGSGTMTIRPTMAAQSLLSLHDTRLSSTQTKSAPQGQQKKGIRIAMLSPGFIYEPYAPPEPISFWHRWFKRSGWRRTKADIIMKLKSAYAINKLRQSGYSKQLFYGEAVDLYKKINILMANGEKTTLRKAVTENMYSTLKSEIKQRESVWHKVYWELIEPIVKIRTLRARMIGVDNKDLNKGFVQITVEFLTKQKFEAYNSKGAVVAGDKSKEMLVHDIWVFEKSLFHEGAYWRLCGRIKV